MPVPYRVPPVHVYPQVSWGSSQGPGSPAPHSATAGQHVLSRHLHVDTRCGRVIRLVKMASTAPNACRRRPPEVSPTPRCSPSSPHSRRPQLTPGLSGGLFPSRLVLGLKLGFKARDQFTPDLYLGILKHAVFGFLT